MVLNQQNMESLLLTHWSEFLDTRKFMGLVGYDAREITGTESRPQNLTITRFELTETGFILWAEFKISGISFTSEYRLSNTGLHHVKTIKA